MIRSKLPVILAVVISLIALVVSIAMIVDNRNYPPLPVGSPGYDYVGNYEGSLTKHLILVVIGLAFSLYFTLRIKKLNQALLYVLLIIFIAYAVWSFSNVMYSGGVVVLYGLWSAFLVLFATSLVIVRRVYRKN